MYGKLVDGRPVIAERNQSYNGARYIPAPVEVLKALGYKEIIYTTQPICEDLKFPVERWVEKESTIEQEWDIRDGTSEEIVVYYKAKLDSTDYQAIKYAEGWITEEEYAPIKAQRQEWRDIINQYQNYNTQEVTE